MNLFALNNTDLNVLGFRVPPAWFQSVNPVAILLFAPVFAWLWSTLKRMGKEPSTALKMTIGLGLIVRRLHVVGGRRHSRGHRCASEPHVVGWGLYTTHTVRTLPFTGRPVIRNQSGARPLGLIADGGLVPVELRSEQTRGETCRLYANARTSACSALPAASRGFLQNVSQTNRGFFSIFVVSSLVAAILMFMCIPLLKRLTRAVQM